MVFVTFWEPISTVVGTLDLLLFNVINCLIPCQVLLMLLELF